ncbi:MAG TPA: hypothetical protein VK421_21140 [Pyrinomonadaceae bacterium]|nr:hypothetical protein [Pyrinomonadaceae bacterium]
MASLLLHPTESRYSLPDDAPRGFDIFTNKEDNCIEIAMRP